MDLILKCIHNHSNSRAHANEIAERLAEMVLQFPASFVNRLEMLRHIETASTTVTNLKTRLDHVENYLASQQQQVAIFICLTFIVLQNNPGPG